MEANWCWSELSDYIRGIGTGPILMISFSVLIFCAAVCGAYKYNVKKESEDEIKAKEFSALNSEWGPKPKKKGKNNKLKKNLKDLGFESVKVDSPKEVS
jgi:hypothetical protein